MPLRIADLFSGAGGAGWGYHLAGHDVHGFDIDPQPNYPLAFSQADAFVVDLSGFDFAHASPMCRDHTPLISVAGTNGSAWQLDATRRMLLRSGKPWVIENVNSAPMRADLKLCGCMFGLRTKRVRKFEFSEEIRGLIPQPPHKPHTARTATSKRYERWLQGWDMSFTGDIGTYAGPDGMGIDWMTGNELCQAIPPAYTEYIGKYIKG